MARSAFRLVALLLLLVTGADLFACEMLEPDRCETFGSQGTNSDPESGDDCLCCCVHVMVIAPFNLAPLENAAGELESAGHPKPESKSFPVYHPPKF